MQMTVAFPKETHAGETRAAMVPELVGKLTALGAKLEVEAGLGLSCGHS
jgi:NAD(P) transhydrogenase subunit alpha